MKMHNYILLIISLLLSVSPAVAQRPDTSYLSAVENKYHEHDSVYFRESVYLHTPVSQLQAGETLFYTAFVTDYLGMPMMHNRNLYVDLLAPDGRRVYSKLHYIDSLGMASGSMQIGDSLLGGTYFLRAYTGAQRNLDIDYMFYTSILIVNEKAEFYTPEYVQMLRKTASKRHRLKVHTAVNGGLLIPDAGNVVSFRLTNYIGHPVIGKIELTDKASGKSYKTQTDRAGNAQITVVPSESSSYKIHAKSEHKRLRKRLNIPLEKSIKIQTLDVENELIVVSILNRLPKTKDKAARTYILLLRVPGKILDSRQIFVGNRDESNFELPLPETAGMTEILLADVNGKPVSREMLFLPSRNGSTQPDFRADTDSFYLSLKLGKQGRASAFISEMPFEQQTDKTVTNYFLYRNRTNAELNPFVSETKYENTAKNYPNLLQTAGFSLSEEKAVIPETAINLHGKLMHSVLDIPVDNSKVELFVLNKHYERFETMTDKNGKFSFEGLHYDTDTLKLKFISKNPRDKQAYIIELEKPENPEFQVFYEKDIKERLRKVRSGMSYYRIHKPYVTAKDSVAKIPGKIHGRAGQILFFDEINTDGYSSTLRVIENYVLGIRRNSMSAMRGYTSFVGSSEPLYLIDGVPTDKSAIDNLPPETVDRVEILKGGPESAIYGIRGANGVVAVYTKRGHRWTPGELLVRMPGYTKAEFSEKPNEGRLLYFFPAMKADEAGIVRMAFPHKGQRTFYTDIQGFDSEGNPFVIRMQLSR